MIRLLFVFSVHRTGCKLVHAVSSFTPGDLYKFFLTSIPENAYYLYNDKDSMWIHFTPALRVRRHDGYCAIRYL